MYRLCATTLAAFAMLFVNGSGAQAATKFRLGFPTSINGPAGAGAKAMAQAVKEKSNGEIELELFGDAQLGGDRDMLSQVVNGSLDCAMIGSNIASAFSPGLAVFDLPFIWESEESYWKVLNGPTGDKLLDALGPKGVKGLAYGSWGIRGFINKGYVINTPGDMAGKRIRVAQSPVAIAEIKALSANPVPVDFTEVYTALQQNAIDSVESSYFAFVQAKHDEVATSLAVTNHAISASIWIMNGAKFAALTPAQQKIMVEAAHAGGAAMRAGTAKENLDAIEEMKKKGLTITRPDPAPFRKLVEPVYEQFAPKFGADLIREVQNAQK